MTSSAESTPELPRGIALAWGVAADPQRGPKREMSVERIVETAVAIADAEGLAGVSMAAVAARLGFTPMSLYRYVSAKDDLILLMQEEAMGPPPETIEEADGWRSRLEAYYEGLMAGYRRHPWSLDIPITGMPITPNGAAWMDVGLEALADTPLSLDDRLAVTLLMAGLARWAGMIAAGYEQAGRGADSARATDEQEELLFRALISADAFPHLRAAIDAGTLADDSDPFRFGVDRSLDGIAAYIEHGPMPGTAGPGIVHDDVGIGISADKKHREAVKAVRVAQKALRDARKIERQVAREARERLQKNMSAD